MSALGTCRCCSEQALVEQGICEVCTRKYGARTAALLARCQADTDFATSFISRMPAPLRERFVAALSAKCLEPKKGPGLRYTRPLASAKTRVSA